MEGSENQFINFGVQECSKCQYKLHCEECVYNEKDISELIKFEKRQTSKETAEKILEKARELVKKWLSRDDEKVGFLFDFEEFIKNIY